MGPRQSTENSTDALLVTALAPRADVFYRVIVKCLQPGTVHFKAQVTSTNLPEPVIKVEATRIYSDAADVR